MLQATMAARQMTRVGLLRMAPATMRPQRIMSVRAMAMASTKLYVGNLSWTATKEDLAQLFSKYGEVEDAFIPLDRETGRSRGFGFVTLESEAAQNALEMDGQEWLGRALRVNEAQAPEPGRGGGGRGGRGGRGGSRGGGRGYGRGRSSGEQNYSF